MVPSTIEVSTLSGQKIRLSLNEVITPTTVKRISGEGLPYPKQNGRKGDLIVEFNILFPQRLSHDQQQAIKNILQ